VMVGHQIMRGEKKTHGIKGQGKDGGDVYWNAPVCVVKGGAHYCFFNFLFVNTRTRKRIKVKKSLEVTEYIGLHKI